MPSELEQLCEAQDVEGVRALVQRKYRAHRSQDFVPQDREELRASLHICVHRSLRNIAEILPADAFDIAEYYDALRCADRVQKAELIMFLCNRVHSLMSTPFQHVMDWIFLNVCNCGCAFVAKELLQDTGWKPGPWSLYMETACTKDYLGLVSMLLECNMEHRAEWTRESAKALQQQDFLSLTDRADIWQRLLADKRLNPNAQKYKALNTACRIGRPDLLDLLLGDVRLDPRARIEACDLYTPNIKTSRCCMAPRQVLVLTEHDDTTGRFVCRMRQLYEEQQVLFGRVSRVIGVPMSERLRTYVE